MFGLAIATATQAAATPQLDNGTVLSFPYQYSGTLTSQSCMNPARGFSFYGDMYVSANNYSSASFYIEHGTLSDPFVQVLADRTHVLSQDDDAGVGLDAYLASASINTSGFLAATTYSANATGTYTLYSTVPLTLLTQCPQVITVSAPSSLTYGGTASYTASTNMGQQVTLNSVNPLVCSVSAASYGTNNVGTWTISTTGAGTCTLEATQSGSSQIEAAPAVRSSFTVGPKTVTLSGLTASRRYDGTTTASVTGTPALSGVVGSDLVSVAGTITSASYASASAGTQTVTVSGLTLSGLMADRYQLSNTITGEILKAEQTLSLTLPTSISYGDVKSLSASSSAGLTVTVTSLTTSVCTASGSSLTAVSAGTCRVRASQAGTSNYAAATSVDAVVSVDVRTLTISGLTAAKTYDGTTAVSLNGTAGLSGIVRSDAVSLTGSITGASYDSATAGSRTVTISGLSLSGAMAASYQLSNTIPGTINKASQTVSLHLPGSLSYKESGSFSASASSGLDVSITALTPSICTISDHTLTAIAAGTCRVQATQSGNTNYTAADPAEAELNIAAQPLTLSGLTATKTYDGDTSAAVTGTPELVGVLDGDQVTLAGEISGASYDSVRAGSRIVTVNGLSLEGEQAGNYRLITTIAGEITQASQSLSLHLPDSLTYGESKEFTSSASSDLSPEITSLTPEVCAVSDRTLAAVASGTCRIKAVQLGNSDFSGADAVEREVEVAKRTLTLTGLTASKDYDGSTDASITGTPGLSGVLGEDEVSVSGSVTSASYEAAGAGSRTVTVHGLGLDGDDAANYRLDPHISGQIDPSNQVISWSDYSLVPSRSGDDLPAAATSGEGELSYAVTDAGSAGCSLSEGKLSFSDLGTCRLQAVAAATENNLEARTEITVTVAKLDRSLGWELASEWPFADSGSSVPAATTQGDGTISYSVVDAGGAGCSLDGRTLTFDAAGSCVLRARVPDTTDYQGASAELGLTVVAGPPPAVPEVAVTMGLKQASVSWTPSANNGGAGEVHYTATAHPGGASCQTTQNWCVVTGLNPKTTYTFTVEAATDAGSTDATPADGKYTAPKSVAPGAAPTSSTGDTSATVTDRHGQAFSSVTVGATLQVTVSGFAPGSRVSIYTYSTPLLLGEAIADTDGNASVRLNVPSKLEAGGHTMAAYGFGTDGTSVRAVATYKVRVPQVETGDGDNDADDNGSYLPPAQPEPSPSAAPSEVPSAPTTPVASPSVPSTSGSDDAPVVSPAEDQKTIGGVSYPSYNPTSAEHADESAKTILTSLTLLSVLTAGAAGASAMAASGGVAAATGAAGTAGAGGLGSAAAGAAAATAVGAARGRRGKGTLKGVKVKHHKFRYEATAWGDRSATWISPLVTSYDAFSLSAPARLNTWSPMVARLFGDAAYLRAILGTWSLLIHVAGVVLGVAAAFSAGLVAVPPTLGLVLTIVVISCLDAGAGFGAAIAYGVTITIGGGLNSPEALRSVLAISLVFFAATLAGTAARPLRRPPSSSPAERFDRITDIVLATLIGAWALSAIVKSTSAIAGAEFPIVNSTNEIVAMFAAGMVARYLLESMAAHYYPQRLAAVAPPKMGFPSPRQQIISAALRTALYLFFAYVYIGLNWYLAFGAVLFFVPSVIAAYQMKLPNLPNVVRWLPKGLIKTVAMLIIGGAFAALVKWLVPDPAQFVQVAFVALGLPGLALGIIGFFAREGETFEMTWLYRFLGIPLLGFGAALATGVLVLF